MTMLYKDKLEHIFYCKSKDVCIDENFFLVSNDYYLIKLKSNNLVFESYNAPINARDRRMLETLGYWLNSNLNLDNIYMHIRLKAINNKDFLKWWTRYNFQIEIESNKEFKRFKHWIIKDNLKED